MQSSLVKPSLAVGRSVRVQSCIWFCPSCRQAYISRASPLVRVTSQPLAFIHRCTSSSMSGEGFHIIRFVGMGGLDAGLGPGTA